MCLGEQRFLGGMCSNSLIFLFQQYQQYAGVNCRKLVACRTNRINKPGEFDVTFDCVCGKIVVMALTGCLSADWHVQSMNWIAN
jgi:hypothetical protein